MYMTIYLLNRILVLLPILGLSLSTKSQVIKPTHKQEFYENIWKVERSFIKEESYRNAIVFSISGYKDLILINDSLKWNGYIFRNVEGPVPQPYVINESGDTISKPVRTVLYRFDGDSLYKLLLRRKIYNLEQFSDDELADMYTKRQTKRTDVKYVLGRSSHDVNVSITTSTCVSKRTTTYAMSLIEEKGLHFVATIRTFFLIDQLLKDY